MCYYIIQTDENVLIS